MLRVLFDTASVGSFLKDRAHLVCSDRPVVIQGGQMEVWLWDSPETDHLIRLLLGARRAVHYERYPKTEARRSIRVEPVGASLGTGCDGCLHARCDGCPRY